MEQMITEDIICRHITENSARLYRLAYSYVKNEQDAMDIVQDSVYKLLKNSDKIKSTEYMDTWLYRVTINTALDFIRKHKREYIGIAELEDAAFDDYSKFYVLDLLDRLDEKSRAVLILRFFENKALAQIAEILGENLNTVKTRLYKAVKLFKIHLEEGED